MLNFILTLFLSSLTVIYCQAADLHGIVLDKEDVASVEVLENHQPLQVLKGLEFSEQAGLNIKLKEGSRRRWIGMINGQIGGDLWLYDAGLFAIVQMIPDGILLRKAVCTRKISCLGQAIRRSYGAISLLWVQLLLHLPNFVRAIIGRYWLTPQIPGVSERNMMPSLI